MNKCDYCGGELDHPGDEHDLLDCGSVLRKRSRELTVAYQELETAVRDLYYLDGDLNKVWVDALTAVAWLKQREWKQPGEMSVEDYFGAAIGDDWEDIVFGGES